MAFALRRTSRIVVISAIVLQSLLYWVAAAPLHSLSGEPVRACGLGALGAFMLSALICIIGSLTALMLNGWSLRREPKPRARWRRVELVAMAAPLLAFGLAMLLQASFSQ